MMKHLFLTLFFLLCVGYANSKMKYLKIDLLHIVLVSENGQLINDSTERAVMRNYIRDGLKNNDNNKVDTIVKIVMANKKFFMGMDKKDIKSLIGNWGNTSLYELTYIWARPEMEEPLDKVILFFRFLKQRVVYIEAPYSSYCCVIVPNKKPKWLRRYYMKHTPAVYGSGRYGL
jgi:hypothetical protein